MADLLGDPGGKVPKGARIIALVILDAGRPLTEQEIVRACRRMKDAGLHDFDLGTSTNLRNRIQRSCSDYKIHREKWGPVDGYADIFRRVPGEPARFKLVLGYKPNPFPTMDDEAP